MKPEIEIEFDSRGTMAAIKGKCKAKDWAENFKQIRETFGG